MKHLQRVLCAHLEARLQGKRARLPDVGVEILLAFADLSRARTYHQHGPNPITWEAIAAYGQVLGQPLRPDHARIVMALDEVWLRDATRRIGSIGNSDSAKPAPAMASGPLNGGMFDALFG